MLTDEQIETVLNDIFSGSVNINNLPPSLYYGTVERLTEGLFQGMNRALPGGDVAFPGLAASFRENAALFSGAKTYQQSKALTDALYKDGVAVSFPDFKKEASGILDTFNVRHLEVEYNSALSTAQAGVQWQQIERDAEALPWLKFTTVGDQAVRDEHAALDGFIARVNDPIWDTLFPPIDWECRCLADQLDDADAASENTGVIADPDIVAPEFRFNPGKTGQLFDDRHPYFSIPPSDRDAAERNFGFPTDPYGPRK